ncbi:MAG: leucine-rich repeat domain-containing protein [Bacillota bacterium]|nr:leucine-rich repeat domain-containing protein [Bacillota bacterium]HHU43276.1 leucine-rich repeat domain-containing protein [Clostridiales bacterium]
MPSKIKGKPVKILKYAFQSKHDINFVTLPEGLEVIGEHAFDSSRISKITISESVKEIGPFAFSSTFIENIIFPQELKKIDSCHSPMPHLRAYLCPIAWNTWANSPLAIALN